MPEDEQALSQTTVSKAPTRDPIALVALGISILGFAVTPVWQQSINRSEAVRAERRAAYSGFIGNVERCSPNASTLASQVAPFTDEIRAVQESADPELAAVETARLLRELSAAELQAIAQCRNDLAESAGRVDLLAGSSEIRDVTAQLRDSAVHYQTALHQVSSLLAGTMLESSADESEEPSQQPSPASSVPPTTPPQTSRGVDLPCSGFLDIDRGDDPVVADFGTCSEDFTLSYVRFIELARSDTQAPVVDWPLVALAVAVVAGSAALVLSVKVPRQLGKVGGAPQD